MRFLVSLLSPVVLLPVVLMPATVRAEEPHSWCVTGQPLNYPSVATDPITSEIINHVCSEHIFFRCCYQKAGGRWDLACVQEGASYATQQSLGDVCGRDAWAQGPIAGTQQYYPRDFNMFALGNASGFRDSQGAVAAQGNIAAAGFNLNWGQNESVALVAQGGLDLNSGQVSGAAYYGTYYRRQNVTYIKATEPTGPSQPINFANAASKLKNMSQAIKAYTAKPASKLYSTITFSGSDPELNVFSVDASLFTGTYSYVIDVPQEASVIINVTGSNPVIQYAGFERRNGLAAEGILWNFPEATNLQFTSIAFPGSILAPYADAQLRSGNIVGTAVVKSASGPDWFELHRAPFEVPVFTCGTPEWDPEIWNDPANIGHNNCYNYANNVLLDHYADPGRGSGEWCDPQQNMSCFNGPQMALYAQNDGLIPTTATATCPGKQTKVALFFQSMIVVDYHWWRQDRDGKWSDKPGPAAPERPGITPAEVTGESKLIGYFCTCSSRTQGGGHASID